MKLSEIQKYLLLTGEREAVVMSVAMKTKKRFKKQPFKLHPDQFTNDECLLLFRFDKQDLFVLCNALGIPPMNTCRTGTKFTGIEGMSYCMTKYIYSNGCDDN
jgi:hypothetical protein